MCLEPQTLLVVVLLALQLLWLLLVLLLLILVVVVVVVVGVVIAVVVVVDGGGGGRSESVAIVCSRDLCRDLHQTPSTSTLRVKNICTAIWLVGLVVFIATISM